ncbi:MAG: hypothetical protein JWP78_1567 [Mucilaginibacter sp.]|nr:hypothetical protein [Mucilaginibacter sp.]
MINEVLNPNVTAGSVAHDEVKKTRLRLFYTRYFFVAMASLFPVMVVIGFTPDYQAITSGGLEVYWFLHVHGAIMASWLLVFLAQAVLAAKSNLKFHRKLGLISVVLGVLVLLSIGIATVHAKIANSPPLGDADAWGILSQQLYGFLLFGLLFTWGILARKNAAAHKRLLFLATLILMQAAVDRIRFLPGLNMALYIRFIYFDSLLIPLFIYDLLTVRHIHKITMISIVCIVFLQFTVTMAWGSPAWNKLAYSLFAPFMDQRVEIKLTDAQTDPLLGYYGDKKWKMSIIRTGGKVYLQLPGVPKFEMAAISETEWFLKTTTWRISFIRSPDGSITKIVNKQPNGTWEVPRFKQQ